MKMILMLLVAVAMICVASQAIDSERLKIRATSDQQSADNSNAEKSQSDRIRHAKKNHELCEGMNYLDARDVLGDLWPVAESDGSGGKYQSYYHNDGTHTTTLYFYNGSLLRWEKSMNH